MGICTVVGMVTVAGTVIMPGWVVFAAMGCAAWSAAAVTGWAGASGRISTQTSATTLTISNRASATTHTGKRRRGAATFTSNSAGVLWRWRSVSDFLSASRMKDISAPGRAVQEWCGSVVERGVESHLRLHSRDAIDREPVLALEVFHQRDQRRVEAIAAGLFSRQSVHAMQAVAQPLHARVTRSQRQRLRAAAAWTPQQYVVAKPAAGQVADADLALRATQIDLRVFVIQAGQHQLMRLAAGVDDVEHRRAIEQAQLRERAALGQALESGTQRLGAGIFIT